jgi:hypothetical protein
MVWELPEGGLTRWSQHSCSKQVLDFSGVRVLRVERQVEEDMFLREFVLFGNGKSNQKLSAW